MRLRVLGGVEVRRAGRWVPVGALKQRLLLAMLLVDAGSPVPMDRLVDELWSDAPPANPERQVHMLVWQLRKLFGADGAQIVRTVRPGYRLALDAGDTDIDRFEELIARGRAALREGDAATASALLTEALGLWRGPAYADALAVPGVRPEATRLDEARLAACESRLDAELRLDRCEGAVAELQGLAAEHPFRERLSGLLMRALHRSGRQAEALEVYRTLYRRLDDDLGVRPGRELHELHQTILADERTAPSEPDGPPEPAIPAELPPDIASLTGRGPELERLLSPTRPGTVMISAIDGMAGIGKTALAVHAAHRLADRHPDGQLFVDLHGFTRGVEPVSPAAALDRLLRSIGVPGDRIPADLEQRSALWRTRTSERRYLVVLDNAASADQVRPLLPAAAGCTVLVTSRRRMGDLDDAVAISLDVLPLPDAVALFTGATGQGRLDGEPDDLVEQAVELCGLPLALRLLASRLRNRPAWTMKDLIDRLRDDRRELIELEVGGRSLASAFRMSYDQLDSAGRRLFRLAGLLPGTDFDAYTAAALADLDLRATEQGLEQLVDAHLLESRTYGRYTFHDLLRAFAADIAGREDSEPERRAALGRLLDQGQHAVSEAMNAYAPAERDRRPDVPPAGLPIPAFDGDRSALRWLDDERTNLIALAGYAAEHGWPGHTCRLAGCLHRYLQNGAHQSEALVLSCHHLRAARLDGDRVEEGRALLNLGVAHYRMGDHERALDHLRGALDRLPQAAGRGRRDRARVLYNLGLVLQVIGHLSGARDRFHEAAVVSRELGDRLEETRALGALARTARHLGRFDEAETYAEQALEATRDTSDRQGAGLAHYSLGITYQAVGRYDDALEHLRAALHLRREIGNRRAEGAALVGIGGALRGLGRYAEALEQTRRGLTIAVEDDDKNGEFEAHQEIGEILLASGRPADALDHLTPALELATALGQPSDQARAHHALGTAHRDLGDLDRARAHWPQALDLYRRLGLPDAEAVRAQLDTPIILGCTS